MTPIKRMTATRTLISAICEIRGKEIKKYE